MGWYEENWLAKLELIRMELSWGVHFFGEVAQGVWLLMIFGEGYWTDAIFGEYN